MIITKFVGTFLSPMNVTRKNLTTWGKLQKLGF